MLRIQMGIYLMVQNCFESNFSGIDIMAVIMAILLGVVYWGSLHKRGSPCFLSSFSVYNMKLAKTVLYGGGLLWGVTDTS